MAAIHFFKIILEHSLQEGRLEYCIKPFDKVLTFMVHTVTLTTDYSQKVPDNFIRKYGGTMQNPVYLKPPDGTEWEIHWTKYESGEVWFEKGWNEVVRYYSLGHGHLVLFKYERTKRTCDFKVNIFDKSALEIDYPLHRNLAEINDDSVSIEILHEKPPLHEVASPKPPLLSSSFRPCKKIRAEEAERTYNHQKKHSNGNKLKPNKAEPNLVKLESEGTAGKSNFSTKKIPKSMAIKKGKEKPLTCDEKERALQRVNTFTAKNPYFKIVMQPAYINNRLCVPASFVKQNLKQKGEIAVLLRVSDGRTWRVKCYREERNQNKFRLKSGWLSFVQDNNLKVGDVCVFVLTNPIDISFLVHVFGGSANPYG